jgi:hypothetical protein
MICDRQEYFLSWEREDLDLQRRLKAQAQDELRRLCIKRSRKKQAAIVGYHQFPLPCMVELEAVLASAHSNTAKNKYLTLVVRGFYEGLGQVEEDKGAMTVGSTVDTLAMLTPRARKVIDKVRINPDLVTPLPMAVTVNTSEFKSVGERTAFAQSILDSQAVGNSELVITLHQLNIKYIPTLPMPWHKREVNIWPEDLTSFPHQLHRGQSFYISGDDCKYVCVGVLWSHLDKDYCIYYRDSKIVIAATCDLYNTDIIKHKNLESLSYIIEAL